MNNWRVLSMFQFVRLDEADFYKTLFGRICNESYNVDFAAW